ncbi:uncharacterized protein LOC117575293 [Drosophila albomicans]|uniref:Uncharacterized protein LOC117575293 n=1 Tax=Drosophila albomicans TaxID=7291 RepID=A0A6P8XG08_DROAB|nr:uncharacterized protein LOC117575293 [Drosophila albomicans]
MLINLFGGKICFMMSVYSYIAISTPAKYRTLRFVSCAIVELLAVLVINISGYSYKLFGYTTSFAIGACCQIAALIYIVMILKEPKLSQMIDNNEPSKPISTGNNMCIQFFNLKLLKDFIKVPFIRRKNNGRSILLLLILAYFLTSQHGKLISDIGWRFSTRFPYYYESINLYNFILSSAIMGIYVGYLLLSKLMKLSDSVMGMLISSITAMFRLAPVFLGKDSISYVTVIFEKAGMIHYVPIQSIASSISNDYGKMFSLFAILQYFGKTFFVRMLFYMSGENTRSFYEVFLYLSIGLIFMACYFLIRRQNTKLAKKDGTNEQQDSINI